MLEITPLKFEDDKLTILDQTLLPGKEEWIELETKEDVWDAIKKLKVRGAPAIGVCAAYGLYISVKDYCPMKDDGIECDGPYLWRLMIDQKHQGKGYGRACVEECIRRAKERGAKEMILGAMIEKVPFYESLGFTAYGDVFYEEEFPHRMMKITLKG